METAPSAHKVLQGVMLIECRSFFVAFVPSLLGKPKRKTHAASAALWGEAPVTVPLSFPFRSGTVKIYSQIGLCVKTKSYHTIITTTDK